MSIMDKSGTLLAKTEEDHGDWSVAMDAELQRRESERAQHYL